MEFDVLEVSGSDASYDLVIEAIKPQPENGYVINTASYSNREKVERKIDSLINSDVFKTINWGIRFNFFKQLPDDWIIEARLNSLFYKMEENSEKLIEDRNII